MNLYNYWKRIKWLYPKALNACISHFIGNHKQGWRIHFKDPDNILSWLQSQHIDICTRKKKALKGQDFVEKEGFIRFELTAPEEETVTAYQFRSREAALYDAIERAFRIIEQRALRSKAQNDYLKNRYWRVKEKGGGSHWGQNQTI